MHSSEIDKRYLDKPYYIAPQGNSSVDAFVVIRDAMQDQDRVALARIVMGHREHTITLEPLGKGILGTTLRYDYEVRDDKDYFKHVPNPKVPKDMVQLARHILDTKAGHFDARKFKDRYETALRTLVQRKARGQKIEPREQEAAPSNVVDLMDALRQSIKGGRPLRSKAPRAARKRRSSANRKKAP